ncbi:MAG: HEAT repeat domain-containing protein [Candidatus Zixiibacteriota bacterium]
MEVKRVTTIFFGVLGATAAWGQGGPPDPSWGADRLAAALTSDDTAYAVEAAGALARLEGSEVAFAALSGAVENDGLNAAVRVAAIRALESTGDSRAAASFLTVLGDDDVRWAAADALLPFKSDALRERLVEVLSGDKKSRRRATAAYALGRLRDDAAFRPLLDALGDEAEEVRVRACAAAAAYGDRAAVEPLIARLTEDKKWKVRLAAAEALGVVTDDRAVRPLCEALDHKKPEIRIAAAESLAAIGDMRAMDALRGRLKVERDDDVTEALTKAVDDLTAAVLHGAKP